MEDYPKTVLQLETRFATEEACRAYLFQLRWPEGFRCPPAQAIVAAIGPCLSGAAMVVMVRARPRLPDLPNQRRRQCTGTSIEWLFTNVDYFTITRSLHDLAPYGAGHLFAAAPVSSGPQRPAPCRSVLRDLLRGAGAS